MARILGIYDLGVVSTKEPFQRLVNQGMILGEDGQKMSKSRGNVVNPDDVIQEYGADSMRLYEMFMGPLEQDKAWNDHAVQGVRRFLVRIWNLMQDDKKSHAKSSSLALQRLLHKTIQIITNDTKLLKFNTAVARFIEFTNLWMKDGECLSKADTITLLTLLAPYAPHMAEELAYGLRLTADGKYHSIHLQKWPKHDESLVQEDTVTIIVQVNGKMRSTLHVDRQTANSKQQTAEKAKKDEKVKKYLEGKTIKKEIFVPGKLVNFVV